jgi:alpha-glucosidase
MRTVVDGDAYRHLSGMTLSLTYPGVPSIYAGDEIGLEGSSGEGGRRTIDWDHPEKWDQSFHEEVKKLISLRRSQSALIDGGLRWLEVADDYLLFLRESAQQSLLIFISRTGVNVEIDLSHLGKTIDKTLYGVTQSGNKLIMNSAEATQGMWEIKG